jgi:hypothetical protein
MLSEPERTGSACTSSLRDRDQNPKTTSMRDVVRGVNHCLAQLGARTAERKSGGWLAPCFLWTCT